MGWDPVQPLLQLSELGLVTQAPGTSAVSWVARRLKGEMPISKTPNVRGHGHGAAEAWGGSGTWRLPS